MKKLSIILSAAVVGFAPRLALAQWDITDVENFGLPEGSITGIITGILNWLLAIIGIVGIIGFIISGLLYLTSAGDEDRMKQAKRAMLYSIVGLIVGLAGLVVINAVDALLNAQSF